jgi:membrane protease YdiL (CAAX protease family)
MTRHHLTTWVRAHPVAALLAWFFPVGWAIAFIPVIANRPDGLPQEVFLIGATWLGLLLPTIVITRIVDGQKGLRALRQRVLRIRASIGWYALVLLAVPITAVGLAAVVYGLPAVPAASVLPAVLSGLLLETVFGFITINLWEEMAWMGFIQARLQARRGVMLGALLTAALFTLQHVPLFVGNGLGALVVMVPAFVVLAVPFRALMAWLYNRTGSLFLIGLVHAVGDATGFGGFNEGLLPRLYPNNSDVALLSLVAQALVGVAVIAATRARLGLPATPPTAAEIIAAPAASGV